MQLRKKAELAVVNILRLEVAAVKANIDSGIETIHIVWGDRGVGKSTAARIVAEELPYAYYVPLQELEENYSVSAFFRLMVEATGEEPKWGAKDNLEILKKLENPVFLLDDAEELIYSPRKRGKTPILLRKVKYLTELGFGFILIGNEDIKKKIALYKEVKRRVRHTTLIPNFTLEDIKTFAKVYGLEVPEKDVKKIYEYASSKGFVVLQLDDVFSSAWFNGFTTLTFKEFKEIVHAIFYRHEEVTA